MRPRSLIFCFCLSVAAAVGAPARVSVVIVSSERSAAYLEAQEALMDELERGGLARQDIALRTPAELTTAAPVSPQLFVALGSPAASALAKVEWQVPVLNTLLPRHSFERVLLASGRKPSSQFSALYLDQPLSRQLDLIVIALPEARRLGVLWGDESLHQAATLKSAAQAHGLDVVEAQVGAEVRIFPGLRDVLEEADVLLAMPDPQVFNNHTIQNILLTSYRAKVPLVAFSLAYVRAGALLALHVTPTQIGHQAALMARGVLQGKSLPPEPLHSQEFSVAVNEHVARSLGLSLDASSLLARLKRKAGAP